MGAETLSSNTSDVSILRHLNTPESRRRPLQARLYETMLRYIRVSPQNRGLHIAVPRRYPGTSRAIVEMAMALALTDERTNTFEQAIVVCNARCAAKVRVWLNEIMLREHMRTLIIKRSESEFWFTAPVNGELRKIQIITARINSIRGFGADVIYLDTIFHTDSIITDVIVPAITSSTHVISISVLNDHRTYASVFHCVDLRPPMNV